MQDEKTRRRVCASHKDAPEQRVATGEPGDVLHSPSGSAVAPYASASAHGLDAGTGYRGRRARPACAVPGAGAGGRAGENSRGRWPGRGRRARDRVACAQDGSAADAARPSRVECRVPGHDRGAPPRACAGARAAEASTLWSGRGARLGRSPIGSKSEHAPGRTACGPRHPRPTRSTGRTCASRAVGRREPRRPQPRAGDDALTAGPPLRGRVTGAA